MPKSWQNALRGPQVGDKTCKFPLDGHNLIPFFKDEVKRPDRKDSLYRENDGESWPEKACKTAGSSSRSGTTGAWEFGQTHPSIAGRSVRAWREVDQVRQVDGGPRAVRPKPAAFLQSFSDFPDRDRVVVRCQTPAFSRIASGSIAACWQRRYLSRSIEVLAQMLWRDPARVVDHSTAC